MNFYSTEATPSRIALTIDTNELHPTGEEANSQTLTESYTQTNYHLFFMEERAGIDCQALENLEMKDLAQVSQEDCQRCGGEWGYLSRDVDMRGCNPKTSDAGKTCTNYGQCIDYA